MKDRGLWVYDIETLKSLFTYTAINIDTLEQVQYVIHKDKDEYVELIHHLRNVKGQIGFNNVNFDYPIIHLLLTSYAHITRTLEPYETISLIYDKAQEIISSQNQVFKVTTAIRNKDVIIPQLDLFRIWHFNNKARATSLKSLQISMNYPNVMDMPIHHSKEDISLNEVNDVLKYNLNDVLSTFEFYKLSLDKISLRRNLNAKYNLKCINYPDTKIGEELTLKLYCEKLGLNPYDVKELRTEHSSIQLKECIFDYIKFNSKEFNDLLNLLKSKTIFQTKGAIKESVVYKGFQYDYGTGGIHGCIKAGVYESNDDYIIIDADVSSLYPSIAIVNNLYPEHLGEVFCDVYENGIVKPRLQAKAAGDMVMSDGFKLSANSVYGKSNDKHSFLMDSVYTMKTTLNGQLMLTMLCENLVNNIQDLTILQVNTDGITVKIKRTDLNLYYSICTLWEEQTKLSLEYVEYSKMVIRDVNNYLAVTTKGKVKYKGAFEVNKDYHKDNSFRIIPLALSNYFVQDIPIEETILNHKNIYDFCGRQKFVGKDYGKTFTIKNTTLIETKEQKNVRYFISNKGSTFVKYYYKGSVENIHKGYYVTIFNEFLEQENYNINYQFYIKETMKEINQIKNTQLELLL